MKPLRQRLTTFPNTSKFVKNSPLRIVFSPLFSVFGIVVKHGLSCLIYCIAYLEKLLNSDYLNGWK